MKRRVRWAAALLTLSLLAACGAPPDTAAATATSVVAGTIVTEGGASALPDPNLRYPEGAQVVRIGADGTRTVLSAGLAAAGAPYLHHDGTRLLFVGREKTGGRFAVYECAVDGTGRRVVSDHATDCIRATYVPDGGIAYAAALDGMSPSPRMARGAAIYVADGEGGAGERITFGAGLETDPTMLSDGRIVFSSWRPDGSGGGRLGLFTVHPDGAGYAPFHLADADLVYPVQETGGDVRFTRLASGAPLERIADWDAPLSVSRDAGETRGETVTVAPRRRPQGQLSSVKKERRYGTLICVDARASGAANATHVRLATAGGERVVLGLAPLAADGSFMALVPADTPFVVELLDGSGALVRGEHGPLWLRGNESRICVTCHDDVETAPPNRRPQAVLGEAADMTGGSR